MTHIALLRGINVGGHHLVAMADVRAMAAGLGLEHPQTLLQSGNLVFHSSGRTPAELERLLEAEAAKRLGREIAFFVRTAAQWSAIIGRNPFPPQAERDPARLVLMVFKRMLNTRRVEALRAAIRGPERVRAASREAYFVYPDGQGQSKLTNAVIDRTLGTSGTARNWNTVLRLAAAANPERSPGHGTEP